MRFPKKVYKYRDWENGRHKNVLLYNELYLASPKDFNDPFDCRIPPNFINLSETEKNDYITKLAISQFDDVQKEGSDMAKVIKDLETRLKDTERFQQLAENLTFTEQDKYYGILSLSLRWNSILLWSHYSNSHKGFCVGFWTKKLLETGLFGGVIKVDYSTNFPNIKPDVRRSKEETAQKLITQTGVKSKDWTYEKEFRFLKHFFPDIPKPFERIINVSNDIISEVILGINISDTNKEEIIEICRLKNIPVYLAKKKPFKFEIDRELIK